MLKLFEGDLIVFIAFGWKFCYTSYRLRKRRGLFMLVFKKLNTSVLQGLGVGFLVSEDTEQGLKCEAFILEHESRFVGEKELRDNLLELGFDIEGLHSLFVSKLKKDGSTYHSLGTWAELTEGGGITKLIDYDINIFNKTSEAHWDNEVAFYESTTSFERLCGYNGIPEKEYPFIETLIAESLSAIELYQQQGHIFKVS